MRNTLSHWKKKVQRVRRGLGPKAFADRLGLSVPYARRIAIDTKYKLQDQRLEGCRKRWGNRREEWAKVDWGKSNSDIARERGVGRERVRQMRLQYGKGTPSPLARKKSKKGSCCRCRCGC